MLNITKIFMLPMLALALIGCSDGERKRISIVGSSTVFPFASIAAEQFAALSGNPTPKVEATGTGGGIKIFCQGAGLQSVDIANASRKMKKSEFEECAKSGVHDIVEIKIGYDGIVVAKAKATGSFNLSRKQLYLALAKEIYIDGKFVPNPYKKWSDIDANLPNVEIDIMGPPPTSGTRDAFAELVLEKGAEEIPHLEELKKSDKDAFKKYSTQIREDGPWKDMGENDNLIVQALVRNPNAYGIFGFAFAEENLDRLSVATIDNKIANVDNISTGEYEASRSLYVYLKKQNVPMLKGLKEFVLEFLSKRAAGKYGYLVSRGLIPLHEEEWSKELKNAQELVPMAAPEK
jgi:phosphate transport system substrate-binding protein